MIIQSIRIDIVFRIQTLNQKLEQASALPKVGETKWKVFYPSVPHLSDNGVFVLDESGQSSLCIKLPLNVRTLILLLVQ